MKYGDYKPNLSCLAEILKYILNNKMKANEEERHPHTYTNEFNKGFLNSLIYYDGFLRSVESHTGATWQIMIDVHTDMTSQTQPSNGNFQLNDEISQSF